MTFGEITQIVQFFAPPALGLIAWYLNGLNSSMKGIEVELRRLNGRLLRLEEWRELHTELDDTREKAAKDERKEIKEDLHRAQDAVQRQISELQLQGRGRPNGTA